MAERSKATITVDKFKGGTNTLVDEARLPSEYATQSINLIQDQDGVWKTRWGFDYYGEEIAGEDSITGAAEYVKTDSGTQTREIIAVGGTTGAIYKSEDGGAWEQVGSITLTVGKRAYFMQIDEYLYIATGYDDLVRYNGTTVTQYTDLDAPANLTATRDTGLSAGDYTLFYQVTALNAAGETVGSTEASVSINKTRDTWDNTADEGVILAWDAVAGASRYNFYVSDESGYEVFLGTTTTNGFTDDGTLQANEYIEVPDDNTTSAPRFGPMEVSGNRLWAVKDPDNRFRTHFSGTGQYFGFFSPFYGGGWVDLEKGGRATPENVVHYRTGKGDPIVTVLCSTPDGAGSIWQIELTSVTVGDLTFVVPITYKVVGSIGTDAPLSVVKARDKIVFANKKGAFELQNKVNLVNVLATDEASQAIRPSWRSLNQAQVANIAAHYFEGKVFFSVPEGSTNDAIVILDLERRNWNWKWTRGVSQFFEYTDNTASKATHFLAVPTSGSRLWEISENISGDFGAPFYQSYISPLIPVSKDKYTVLKARKSLVELGRPKGTITYEILGIGAKGGISQIGSKEISDIVSLTGFSWDRFSTVLFSSTSGSPTTFAQSATKRSIKLRNKVYYIQHKVWSQSANTSFTILSFQTKGRLIQKREPSSWRS